MAEAAPPVKKMPKGGRKGGTKFPHITLGKALEYSKKLVSKTHTGPLPESTIFAGVFQNQGGPGRVRASALKQYGLLQGTSAAYQATQLAKDIDAAPETERLVLLQQSCLTPKVFAEIIKTYKGDSVSRAKLEQRVRSLDVHPESSEMCAKIFLDSALTAGLGVQDGDNIIFGSSLQLIPEDHPVENGALEEDNGDEAGSDEPSATDEPKHELAPSRALFGTIVPNQVRSRSSERSVAVNIEVNSSTDTEKLENNLKVLRSFGLL